MPVLQLLKRLFRFSRRKERHQVRLRILLKTPDGQEKDFYTEDLSESGFRVTVPVSELTRGGGGKGDLELDIVLKDDAPPAHVSAKPTWTRRMPDGTHESGWTFTEYLDQARERISAFLRTLGRGP